MRSGRPIGMPSALVHAQTDLHTEETNGYRHCTHEGEADALAARETAAPLGYDFVLGPMEIFARSDDFVIVREVRLL